ncbi:hypothetical protein ACFO5O_13090 [Geojedonia litorea]|uniref:Uncharacterized protein n=1 Tax=Geojedonia litorea TaxID=1268269 RepID=A0ABV9N636_9FLAO
MKNIYFIILVITCATFAHSQVQDGTLTLNGAPNFSQIVAVMEAGLDDAEIIPSDTEPLLSFILNSTIDPITGLSTSAEENCETVYLYKVFLHTVNAPTGAVIKAKTYDNSGDRFPLVSNYDTLPPASQYFGQRDLTAETAGADIDGFITIPNDATQAIKVFQFKGCRENIPIEFRATPNVFTPSGSNLFQVVYTITAEPFS